MVFIHGEMVEDMKVIIKMIKRKDLEYIFGKMVGNMKVNGLMVNNMAKENIMKWVNVKQEYGMKVKELNGQIVLEEKERKKINNYLLLY